VTYTLCSSKEFTDKVTCRHLAVVFGNIARRGVRKMKSNEIARLLPGSFQQTLKPGNR